MSLFQWLCYWCGLLEVWKDEEEHSRTSSVLPELELGKQALRPLERERQGNQEFKITLG